MARAPRPDLRQGIGGDGTLPRMKRRTASFLIAAALSAGCGIDNGLVKDHGGGGNVPVIDVSPETLSFSDVAMGESGTKVFTVSSVGGVDLDVTDIHLDPPGGPESPFHEKPLRLPWCWWTFQPPVRTTIADVSPPPCLKNGFVTFGSLNNFVKVNERVRDLWARLVAGVPGARLMIHMKESRARDGLLEFLAARGLPPERVTLVGYQDGPSYMATYGKIDIALDPAPFAGGTTTFDALWMGVPVVSHAGERASSRGGLSILATLGRPEWVGANPEEMIAIARRLASDQRGLAAIRSRLRDALRASPLMDNKGFTRELEELYRLAWRQWCAGHRLK